MTESQAPPPHHKQSPQEQYSMFHPNNNGTTLTANQKGELLLWSGLCTGTGLIRAQKLVRRSDMWKSMKGEEHARLLD